MLSQEPRQGRPVRCDIQGNIRWYGSVRCSCLFLETAGVSACRASGDQVGRCSVPQLACPNTPSACFALSILAARMPGPWAVVVLSTREVDQLAQVVRLNQGKPASMSGDHMTCDWVRPCAAAA
jgi:hypothetical protein